MNDFEYWLREIHVGPRGNPLSKQNWQSVMKQVRKLVAGDGITYCNWPAGKYFHRGTKFNLTHDFVALHREAKDFEATHGRDKGNGWLLQHPIKKLDLYKEYIEKKRNERTNPINIS